MWHNFRQMCVALKFILKGGKKTNFVFLYCKKTVFACQQTISITLYAMKMANGWIGSVSTLKFWHEFFITVVQCSSCNIDLNLGMLSPAHAKMMVHKYNCRTVSVQFSSVGFRFINTINTLLMLKPVDIGSKLFTQPRACNMWAVWAPPRSPSVLRHICVTGLCCAVNSLCVIPSTPPVLQEANHRSETQLQAAAVVEVMLALHQNVLWQFNTNVHDRHGTGCTPEPSAAERKKSNLFTFVPKKESGRQREKERDNSHWWKQGVYVDAQQGGRDCVCGLFGLPDVPRCAWALELSFPDFHFCWKKACRDKKKKHFLDLLADYRAGTDVPFVKPERPFWSFLSS